MVSMIVAFLWPVSCLSTPGGTRSRHLLKLEPGKDTCGLLEAIGDGDIYVS